MLSLAPWVITARLTPELTYSRARQAPTTPSQAYITSQNAHSVMVANTALHKPSIHPRVIVLRVTIVPKGWILPPHQSASEEQEENARWVITAPREVPRRYHVLLVHTGRYHSDKSLNVYIGGCKEYVDDLS